MRGGLYHPAIEANVTHAASRNMGALETAMSGSKNDNDDVIVQKVILPAIKTSF